MRAVHLKTTFHAIVDGSSGDTHLQPVEATVLNTPLTATGFVDEAAMLSQALYREIVESMPAVELDYSKHRRKIDQTGQPKLNA